MVELFRSLLGKTWDVIRPHLVTVSLIACVIGGGVFLLSKSKDDIVSRLQKQQAIHDEELRKVNEAIEVERKQHEENIKKLRADLAAVQQKYAEQIKSLEEKRASQINDLLKKFNTNPVEMARQLSQITGFKLVLPSEK